MYKKYDLTPEMKDRIVKIRKDHPGKLTQTEFGDLLGITKAMVVNLENPNRLKVIREDVLNNICSTFDINKEWLLTGEGTMYHEGLIPELAQVLRNNPVLESLFKAMLDNMGPSDWEALTRVVEKAMKKEQP